MYDKHPLIVLFYPKEEIIIGGIRLRLPVMGRQSDEGVGS